jgi:5'-nucleotidase
MKKLSIAVDMDGIIVDLASKWLELYNDEYGHGATLDDLQSWDMSKNVKIGKEIYKYLYAPGMHLDSKPLPGAIEGLCELHEAGHEVHIVTATVIPKAAAEKLEWCAKHLPFLPHNRVTISNHKARFVSDVFIDDSPHNLTAHAEAQPQAIRLGIAWPYNAEVEKVMHLRAPSFNQTIGAWRHIVDFIKNL